VILATTAVRPGFSEPRKSKEELLAKLKRERAVDPGRKLVAEQLTRDCAPEYPEEAERIRATGGEIRKMDDEQGNQIGPFRVWKLSTAGLGITRSLEDVAAHEVGVASRPIVTSHVVDSQDFFLIIAPYSLWEVMENQEVCDFGEAFRDKSPRNRTEPCAVDVVSVGKVAISQLVCEEARARWVVVAEDEDITISDMSCVILELKIAEKQIEVGRNAFQRLRKSLKAGAKTKIAE